MLSYKLFIIFVFTLFAYSNIIYILVRLILRFPALSEGLFLAKF